MMIAIFNLQDATILPTKFQVNWPFLSGEELQTRMSRCHYLGFPITMSLALLIYKLPKYFLPGFESVGLSVQKKKHKIDFEDGGHLGFPTGMILSIFEQQVALISTKFGVSWAFRFRRRSEI